MGIFGGRVMFRMNSRPIQSKVTQKFVENINFKKPEPVVSVNNEQHELEPNININKSITDKLPEIDDVDMKNSNFHQQEDQHPNDSNKQFNVEKDFIRKQLLDFKRSSAKTSKTANNEINLPDLTTDNINVIDNQIENVKYVCLHNLHLCLSYIHILYFLSLTIMTYFIRLMTCLNLWNKRNQMIFSIILQKI